SWSCQRTQGSLSLRGERAAGPRNLVSFLGVIGNALVIWVTGFKMKKTVNTVWFLNLAVADFLLLIFLPFHIIYVALNFNWPFGAFMCKITYTSLMLNMFASVFLLMVISVDRCVSVVRPVWAQNHRNVRKASFVSLSVWMLALVLGVPTMVFFDTLELESDGIMCLDKVDLIWRQVMTITPFLLGFSIPFIIIVTCYAVIIYHLKKKRTLASQSRHAFKIIAAIIIAFFLCWTPYHLLGVIVIVDEMTDSLDETLGHIINIGYPIATSLAFLNSCLNPLLYVFMGQDFKKKIYKSLPKVSSTNKGDLLLGGSTNRGASEGGPQKAEMLLRRPEKLCKFIRSSQPSQSPLLWR
uniref:Formyl peptide receptor 1 n=1 Tax=Oryzias latipes TaxID=8090 RepID=H2N2K6_ORYLA